MHAFGLSRRSGYSIGRFFGTLLTWLLLVLLSAVLLVHAWP
jgi:uncharacterized membrane protein YecN with MAPEG domain